MTRLLVLFDLTSTAEVVACRGTGGSSCVLSIVLSGSGTHEVATRMEAV
jgi:hypothetical protein